MRAATRPRSPRPSEWAERDFTAPTNVLWRHGDVTFHAWVRPLLPDEADCRAGERRHER